MMAIIPTKKPLFSLTTLMFLLMISINTDIAKAASFTFTEFIPNLTTLTLQGTAQINSNGTLALTKHVDANLNTGRALFTKPVTIWNMITGLVTSFVTTFTFTVQNIPGATPADGIIFFLSPESNIPDNSRGGNLGVFDNKNPASNQFVGVEFDSYNNSWDPNFPHVGINVNNVTSVETAEWNRESGALVTVTITYETVTRILSVVAVDSNGKIASVTKTLDLRALLPAQAFVGLSATTATSLETHDIHFWTFTSTLP